MINSEFTRREQLTDFEVEMLDKAAALLNLTSNDTLAGNSHNTAQITRLFHEVYQKPILEMPFNDEIVLKLCIWHGHAYVLTDDLIGVFCSRSAARALMYYRWPNLNADQLF